MNGSAKHSCDHVMALLAPRRTIQGCRAFRLEVNESAQWLRAVVAKSTARLRWPPFPSMQDQRERSRQRQHGSKPDGRIAAEDRGEPRPACGPRHLRKAEQTRREAGLPAEWRERGRTRQWARKSDREQDD